MIMLLTTIVSVSLDIPGPIFLVMLVYTLKKNVLILHAFTC